MPSRRSPHGRLYWIALLIAGVLLTMAGFRALLYGGGAIGGLLVAVAGVVLLVLAEVARHRSERARRGG